MHYPPGTYLRGILMRVASVGCLPGAWRRGSWHFQVASLHLYSSMDLLFVRFTIFPSWANVGLVHKNHIVRTCLMYHAACKVEFQPFKRLYSQLTFFNFLKIRFRIVSNLGCSQNRQNRYTNKNKYLVTNTSEPRMPQHRTWCQASRQSRTWYHTYVGIPDFRNRPVGVTALFSEPLVSHTNSKYFFPKTRLRF